MNELAKVFDLMGISTRDVLAAAGTKWNFLRFSPGLVGGHCIGVDPYYLTAKAEELGYRPEVILAGRRTNDSMGKFIAEKLVKLLANADGTSVKSSRIGVLGITFKENVPDLRNSRVPDIVAELKEYGISPLVHDPLADSAEALKEYGVRLSEWKDLSDLDGMILAVAHADYMNMGLPALLSGLKKKGVLIDVKSALDRKKLPEAMGYFSL